MKYFQLLWKKSNFVSSRKQPRVSSDYNLQSPVDVQISNHMFKQKKHCKTNGEMRKYKAKAIQAYLGIFTNIHACSDISKDNQTYSGIFKNYSDIFQTLCDPGIFRIMVYSKLMAYSGPLYIQISGTFRIRDRAGSSEPESYSEPCQASAIEHVGKQLTAIIIFVISAFRAIQFMK